VQSTCDVSVGAAEFQTSAKTKQTTTNTGVLHCVQDDDGRNSSGLRAGETVQDDGETVQDDDGRNRSSDAGELLRLATESS
jgi:hypothetical protein